MTTLARENYSKRTLKQHVISVDVEGVRGTDTTELWTRRYLDEMNDIVLVTDMATGVVTDVNERGCMQMGWEVEDVVGHQLLRHAHPDDVADIGEIAAALLKGETGRYTQRWKHSSEGWRVFDVYGRLIDQTRLLICGRDITEAHTAAAKLTKLNEDLTEMATKDALTGLANRSLLTSEVASALEAGHLFAALLLDVDNFKLVNDTLGHDIGDQLLIETAKRLREQTRAEDVVARFGGDEFVVLLRDVQSETIAAKRANQIRNELSAPYEIAGRLVHSPCSIGIALAKPHLSATDLIRNADIAMYKAKDRGRNRYEVFTAELQEEVDDRFELEADLRQALSHQTITSTIQGIFDVKTGQQVGCEALVRWNHPTRGEIAPELFVGIAEDCQILDELSNAVLTQSLRVLGDWLKHGDRFLTLNVAPSQIRGQFLQEDLESVLKAFGVAASRIVIEITEVGLTGALVDSLPSLQALAAAGFKLAIDDFGKGASSLGYLRDLPLYMVKIDGSFVHHLSDDEGAATITGAVIDLANRLGLSTVAECVETPEQLETLRGLGCELVQGWHLQPPVPASEVKASLPDFEAPVHEGGPAESA